MVFCVNSSHLSADFGFPESEFLNFPWTAVGVYYVIKTMDFLQLAVQLSIPVHCFTLPCPLARSGAGVIGVGG
jgi:hypothetical protein